MNDGANNFRLHGKRIYFIVILVLSLLNILLQVKLQQLKTKIQYQNKLLKDFKVVSEIIEANAYEATLEGLTFPMDILFSFEGKRNLFHEENNKYFLILLFSLSDCNVCVEDEIQYFEDLYLKSLSCGIKLSIIAIAHASSINMQNRFRGANNLSFPLIYDNTDTLRKYFDIHRTPLSFLVDRDTKKILKTHFPVAKVPEESVKFIQFIERLFTQK